MGKAARAKRKNKRLEQKRRIKNANRAMYDAFKASGTNSKRQKRRNKRITLNKTLKGTHPFYCGNHACNKCFPKKQVA